MTVDLRVGDSRDVLRDFPDNHFAAVVTDPPYGLSREPDIAEVLTHWLAGDDYQHKSPGFMQAQWDSFVPGPATWREVIRTMRPGAHLLCFASTRTVDLMGISLRLAGFEIRDCIRNEQGRESWPGWVHGQGFAKGKNISKAIDEEAGAEREVVGVSPFASRKPNGTWAGELYGNESTHGTGPVLTAPATDAARQWEGFHSALKPAWEPVLVCRKPLSEPTIAANVLRWSCAGLNVGACRVAYVTIPGGTLAQNTHLRDSIRSSSGFTPGLGNGAADRETPPDLAGRFPSNCVHDGSPEVLAAFAAAGERRSAGNYPSDSMNPGNAVVFTQPKSQGALYADTGSASRFMFCAKASARDRVIQCLGCGRRAIGKPECGCRGAKLRSHSTVKPLTLMQYLVKLVNPPGGILLDPFAGTATTGAACQALGFDAVLIERDPVYAEDARHRLAHTSGADAPLFADKAEPAQQLGLFGEAAE